MATGDNNQGDPKTPTGAEDVRRAVENANAADDGSDDDDSGDDAGDDGGDDDSNGDDDGSGSDDDSNDDGSDDDGDDSDDSDDDDGDGDDDDSGKPKKGDPKSRKFSQFAGDGSDEAYLSNLEKGYQNSSAEAIRLKGDLDTAQNRIDTIMRAAQADPDLAAKLNKAINDGGGSGAGGSGSDGNSDDAPAGGADNPFVRNLQAEWQEKSEKEIETFIEANPEVATDPQIAADVKHWMNVFSTDAYNRTGKLMSGGEAMALAYKHLGLENKLGKQNLADGAKKTATPTRSRGKAKKGSSSKQTFTAEQIAFAQSMGKDQEWLEKNAK